MGPKSETHLRFGQSLLRSIQIWPGMPPIGEMGHSMKDGEWKNT